MEPEENSSCCVSSKMGLLQGGVSIYGGFHEVLPVS
jgi:hypothetical protein